MRRSSGFKGQWFIISAIVITSAFLAISTIFRGYTQTDTAMPHLSDDGTFFDTINETVRNIEDSSPDCATMGKSMEEFTYLLKKQVAERGIAVTLNYDICVTKPNGIYISLLQTESENMKIWGIGLF